jgi:hypothetical protein
MKILCKINQAECFRRGIDAPLKTIKLEVDPSKLPDYLRSFVADHLFDGYKLGFGPHEDRTSRIVYCTSPEFELYRPDLVGFMQAILRAREFEQYTVDQIVLEQEEKPCNPLPFSKWLEEVSEATNDEREKRVKELAEGQSSIPSTLET